jgi:hypothetical protein
VTRHAAVGAGASGSRAFLVLAVFLACGVCHPLHAQQKLEDGGSGAELFPPTLVVRPLLGGPYRIAIGGGPIWVERDPPGGSGSVSPEADVAFGYRLPVYRFLDHPDGLAIDLAIEGGLDARFALGQGHNGLINSDFLAGIPMGFRFDRGWEASFALVHVSSHLGDNVIEQTPEIELTRVSRNGVEATVVRRVVSGLRAYVGGVYNFATASTEEVAGRLGLNLDRMAGDPRGMWPIGSIDLEITDLTESVSMDVIIGLGLRTGAGALQLGITGHLGPTGMGQFRSLDEEYVGLFLRVVTGVVARSGLHH